MPPVRRSRHADPSGSPYHDGSPSYRRRLVGGNVRGESNDDDVTSPTCTLPDDVLFGIFSRVSGFTDAARWARVVATRAGPISRALPPPPGGFLPNLAIGVLLQRQRPDKDDVSRRRALRGAQLRFVPTAFASRPFAGGSSDAAHLLGEGVASFDGARPVASRNGRVVLQLRREARADGLALCVWNPMTRDVAMVPALSGKEYPGDDYACAILTGGDLDDDDVPPCCPPPGFFRLLLVYPRRGYTALRSYSSDTGSWGLQGRKPGAMISSRVLRQLGPAIVLHGVAYWPMHHAAFGVRMLGGGTAAPTAMDMCSVPYRYKYNRCKLEEHVLGVSADGRLNFVGIGIVRALGLLSISFLTSQLVKSTIDPGDDEDDISINVPQIPVTSTTPIRLCWFGEKSGTLIFTVEETSSTSAVYALNVATRSLEKLAGGVSNHTCCRTLYGYEMDRAALLASVAPQ